MRNVSSCSVNATNVLRVQCNLYLGQFGRKSLGEERNEEDESSGNGRSWRSRDLHGSQSDIRYYPVPKLPLTFSFSLFLSLRRVFYKCEIRTQESIIRIFWYFWFRRLWTWLYCTGRPEPLWLVLYLMERGYLLSFTCGEYKLQLFPKPVSMTFVAQGLPCNGNHTHTHAHTHPVIDC